MPPRLIVLADPKMLPALASGLREGGRFEVVPLAVTDLDAAVEAVANADAVAIFYGAPGVTLSAALASLAPAVRAGGGRAIAVLQRDQAAQRDECLRAGATDVVFMPMPKDQFVGRLLEIVGQRTAAPPAARAPRPAADAPRAAPVSGPPPGFANRTREPANPRPAPARPAPPRATPPSQPRATPPSQPRAAPAGSLDDLFDAPVGAPAASPTPPAAVPTGPQWPTVPAVEACRAALIPLLHGEKNPPAGTPTEVALAARKLAQVLSLAERSGIQTIGPGSAYGDAAVARVALEAVRSEGLRLASGNAGARVDEVAVGAVVQIADSAASRLQKEADAAIVKAQVETLQSIKAASAALSRDLLSFKEVADRLRGLGAAPRLGAGGLDPDVVVAGQQPPRPPPQKTEAPQIRPELKDFAAFHEPPGRARRRAALTFGLLLLAGGVANFVFLMPRVRELPRDQLPAGVSRVEVSGTSARVVVAPSFAEVPAGLKLIELLRDRHVEAAALFTQTGTIAGQVDVKAGKLFMIAPLPQKAAAPHADAPAAATAAK